MSADKGRQESAASLDDVAPSATALPVHVERRGSRILACVLFAVACVLFAVAAGLAAAAVMMGWGARGAGPLLPARIGMACGAAVLVLIGLSQLRYLLRWDFTPDEVRRSRHGLFGERQWSEPLSAYEGVIARTETRQAGQATYTVYVVRLKHASNKRRTVQLYCSRSRDGHRAKQEHYARLFRLPLLVETAEGVVARSPEDLDKTVAQRVAEGSLTVQFDPAARPPDRRLQVALDGGRLTLTTRLGAMHPAAIALSVIGSALGTSLLAFALIHGAAPAAMRVAALALSAVAVAAGAACLGLREELTVSPQEVRRRWRHPWGTFGERRLPAERVDDVILARMPGARGGAAVEVRAGEQSLRFGAGLPRVEKRWVRDCVIAVLAGGR